MQHELIKHEHLITLVLALLHSESTQSRLTGIELLGTLHTTCNLENALRVANLVPAAHQILIYEVIEPVVSELMQTAD